MSDTSNTAFVRHEPIPPSPPPSTAAGPVAWIRTNLFDGWFNSILTILAFYFIVQLAVSVLPWMINGVWNTNSLRECREALDGTYGACFSVLSERWNQLLFGIAYPSDQYWRPSIAFVLLFVAAAPVLFFDLPRKLLIFTGLYPFLAYWLIWGGDIWLPIGILATIAIAFKVFSELSMASFSRGAFACLGVILVLLGDPISLLLDTIIAAINLVIVLPIQLDIAIFGFSVRDIFPLIDWPVSALEYVLPITLEPVASRDMGGFMLNMILGTVCVSLSLPLGILLALGRQSDMPIIKGICIVFIEFIRGVPLITLLFVANVVLAYFFPPGSNIDLILRVIIMITLFSAAYIAEVIRGGLAALPTGQYEAGDSLGLDYPQAMRLIILPQALKISIPGIVNVAVGLFKDTTLVSVISMFDLVGVIRGPILASAEWQGIYWELFMAASVLFFVVCYGISQYSQWLERRLATDHR